MAKAKKLASGNWRCLAFSHYENIIQPDGTVKQKRKYESFTASTKKEAEFLATQFSLDKKNPVKGNDNFTVYELTDKYINIKKEVLSPSTIAHYISLHNGIFKQINNVKIKDLSSDVAQEWISLIAVNHSTKTVKNAYGLLSAVIKLYYPQKLLTVKLPQKKQATTYVPTDADINMLIKYLKKNNLELLIAVYLAAFGTLRRSEISALTANDVDRKTNTICINKAMVKDVNNQWIVKSTKNISSTRNVVLPDFVIKVLPKKGYLCSYSPDKITRDFIYARKKLDMRYFRFHDLRHYSASIMHAIGVPDVYIMARGGWSSDYTLKNIYRGSMDDFEKKFTDMTNSHFENMQHEMQHEN